MENVLIFTPFIMMQVTLLSYVTSNVMTFTELKFGLEKWRKGEFNVGRNDVKRGNIYKYKYIYIYI